MESKGIDVSSFQGNIDWPAVGLSDIEFAIVRATYGTTGVDRNFKRNMEGIKGTDIYPGSYHYCYAHNKQEAIAEAKHFLDCIKPYPLYYPAALDLEELSIAELGKDAVTDIILAFTNTLRDARYYPILYTNPNWLMNYIDTGRIQNLDIWLAQWGPEFTYKKNVTIWQYSQDGSVPGIGTGVDMNISYCDYPSMIKENGCNGTGSPAPGPGPEPEPEPGPSKPIIYTVKPGDTLWEIAERFLGDGQKFREIMALNSLSSEVIYPGQILRIPQNLDNGYVVYRIKRGDTLWEIAQRFLGDGSKYRDIMRYNGLISETIYPGQIIRVPVEATNVTITYEVKSGDTLWGIARRFLGDGSRYEEIMQLSGLDNENISVGQKLKIPSR